MAQSQDPLALSCLNPDQVRALALTATKLKELFKLDDLLQKYKEAGEAKDAIAKDAAECNERRHNPISALLAELDGCTGTLRKYNSLNMQEREAFKRLSSSQETVLRQLQIERRQFPACG